MISFPQNIVQNNAYITLEMQGKIWLHNNKLHQCHYHNIHVGSPAHLRPSSSLQFHKFSIQFRPEKLTAFNPISSVLSNCHSYSFFVNQIWKLSIHIRQLSLKLVSGAKRVRNATCRIKLVIFSNKVIILSFKFVKCYIGLYNYGGRRFWEKLWRKWMPIDEIDFAITLVPTYTEVTEEFELQLTKTGDKARNWVTMLQNWLTKDEIETSIRTFQSVRDEIENT